MPRILRILNRFNLGGPTYNAAYLTKYLSSDYETLLVGGAIDSTEKNSEYIVKQLGIEPVIIPEMKREISPKDDYVAYYKLKKLIKEFKPDIVHTHASKAGALGRHAAMSMEVPVILHTFHGHVFDSYFSRWKSSFYKKVERYLANRSDCIVAISETQKWDLTEKYKICSPDKVAVVPLGFDLSSFRVNMAEKRAKFRDKYRIADDEIAIGIIGRLVPVKNHSMFLEALKIAESKTTRRIRAFIVGDGESRELIKAKAIDMGIDFVNGADIIRPATLTFTSWITEMDYVNAGLDIVALTSLNEGTPVSLIEAQAAGKPIVATRVGGIENVVIPGQTALLAERDNTTEFAQNLLRMIEDEDLRHQYSLKGWEHVARKYQYQRLINDMQLLYNGLLNGEFNQERVEQLA